MTRILLFILITGLAGCASTAGHKKSSISQVPPKNEYTGDVQGSRVYGSLQSLLQRGTTINIMAVYKSSYDGLPEGYGPANFGCDTDSETVVETENIFLLDSFSKYHNFSVIDRSQMETAFNEMKLGMSQVTSPSVQPGAISGTSHLIVIEGKNHFFRMNSRNKDRYTETKKLLDIQRNVVIAMDKMSEERYVEYNPHRREQEKAEAQAQAAESSRETARLQQLPPIIEVTPAQAPVSEKVETISIVGDDEKPKFSQSLQPPQAGQQPSTEVVYVQAGPVKTAASKRAQRAVKKIPDWELARRVKQRFPDLKDKDDATVIQNFIKKHPEYRNTLRKPAIKTPPQISTNR